MAGGGGAHDQVHNEVEDITETDRYLCCPLGTARELYCSAHSTPPSDGLGEVARATEERLKMGFMLCTWS